MAAYISSKLGLLTRKVDSTYIAVWGSIKLLGGNKSAGKVKSINID